MKTSQLIKLLQEADPNDECTVGVDNYPVRYIMRLPWYYDGRAQIVERDANNKPIKVGYKAGSPNKIKIHYDTIEDALLDNPDAELELSGITYNGEVDKHYMDPIREWQEEGRKYQDWEKRYDEARKNGTKEPPFYDEPKKSILKRIIDWLTNR